ncbi:UDP-2,3-diacylglucosamine diphosphatase [Imhoffiella purpurea]|uniref:UDP-2,3-diacylglucosamine hydrolase n=1 Tax=Imhoffiella purpurea TaxID=1249627 RepID=W9V789_9GAMM|nr:UDP-2,3-diacylglucosamine diphosphatase [Imhoffiella purpurea]EXJ15274.1 UDP-2,3-diacylglucosamine hydrolase [Imhoffiella purpurea]
MTDLFISDLHLSPDRPATLELFIDFLAGRARQASRLYILGDLFDSWIGDDDDSPFNRRVTEALRALTESGVRCDLMHGNRDFLLGRRFRRGTGCRPLPDPTLASFAEKPTLLMHGDLLCTDDLAYQRFRKRVRNPLAQRLFLFKSLASRRALADEYRRRSREAMADKAPEIMDVNPDAVVRYLRRFGARHLIHGHTHRPRDHEVLVGGAEAKRSVLAEWSEQGGEILTHCDGVWQREPVTAS